MLYITRQDTCRFPLYIYLYVKSVIPGKVRKKVLLLGLQQQGNQMSRCYLPAQ